MVDGRGALPSSMTVRVSVWRSRSTPRSQELESRPCSSGWLTHEGCLDRFIRPGKPNENAYIESFNGKFRDECLNEHWFLTMAQARIAIATWRVEYNTERPDSSLGDLTPEEYAGRGLSERRRTGIVFNRRL